MKVLCPRGIDRLACGALVLAAFLAFLCGPAVLGGEAPSLRAGAAAVDITPKEFPINMPGGFSKNFAEGVHDPLHSRALVLDDGTTPVAIVVVDNLGEGMTIPTDPPQSAFVGIFEPGTEGRTWLTNSFTIGSRAGIRRRGQTIGGDSPFGYRWQRRSRTLGI